MSARLLRWAVLLGLVMLHAVDQARAQDLETALDDMPLVTAALLQALEGNAAFTARVQVEVKYRTDPKSTTGTGTCAWQENKFRWDINVAQLRGPLISTQAAHAVNRLNLGPVVLLARADSQRATLVLNGAKACLQSKLAVPDGRRRQRPIRLGNEMVDGQKCLKEKLSCTFGKRRAEILVWKPVEKACAPSQVAISLEAANVYVRFYQPRPSALLAARFGVPPGCTPYSDFEDLIQSLLWDRMKASLGWPAK